MRATPVRVMLSPVDHQRGIRLTLYVDAGCEPLSGTVQADDEEARRFEGWIELASAIARAQEQAPAGRDEVPDRSS